MTASPRAKSARSLAHRSKQWTSGIARPELQGLQNSQRSYERYLALAEAQTQSGDVIGAENYYSTLNIISDRCRQTEKRNKRFRRGVHGTQQRMSFVGPRVT